MPKNSNSNSVEKRITVKNLTAGEAKLTEKDMKKVKGGVFPALPSTPPLPSKLQELQMNLQKNVKDWNPLGR